MAAPMENVCDTMISTVFQALISNKSDDRVGNDGIRHVLDIIQANELLSSAKTGNVQDVVSHVHSCLGSSKLRGEGLLLLNVLIKQCNTSIFQQHALTWIKFLIQIIQGHCAAPVYSACCQLLGQIIIQSKNFSDLTRELTTSVIPQLLPLLIAAPLELCQSALCCINHCIRTYPGPIGPFKNKIEAVVLRELDKSTTSETVYKCFSLLSRCGPGGTGGIKYTEAWTQQTNLTLGSLENTLTDLYEGIETRFSSEQSNRGCLNLSTIESSARNRVTSLVSRWQTLSGCLQALLSVDMYSTVKVPVDVLVQLVCRCLSINTNIVMCRPTTERTLLASYIPDIHTAALCILDHIIVLCKKNLVPHSSIIVSVLSQELLWTQSDNLGFNKQYGYLRSAVYSFMITWLKVMDGCCGIVIEENNLIKQILHDCSPYTESLQLASGSKLGSSMESSSSKKGKKRKGYQELSHGISSQRKLHPHANCELVLSALDALYWIIMTSASEMSAKKLQEVQAFVIQTLLTIQQALDRPIPYSSPGCRKGLYKVLQSLILASHSTAPPPIQCAVGIFSTGTLDHDTEVSSVCMEAKRVCEALIHPRVPCLNGPIICQQLVHIGNISENSNLESSINTESSLEGSYRLDREDMSVDLTNTSLNRSTVNENGWKGQKNNKTLKRKRPEDFDISVDNKGDGGNKSKKQATAVEGVEVIEDDDSAEQVSDDHSEDGISDEEISEVDEDSNKKIAGNVEENVDDDEDSEDDDDGNDDNVDKNVKIARVDGEVADNNNHKNGGDKALKMVHDLTKIGNEADKVVVSSDDEDGGIKQVIDMDKDLEHKTGEEKTDLEVENMLSTFIDAGPDSD